MSDRPGGWLELEDEAMTSFEFALVVLPGRLCLDGGRDAVASGDASLFRDVPTWAGGGLCFETEASFFPAALDLTAFSLPFDLAGGVNEMFANTCPSSFVGITIDQEFEDPRVSRMTSGKQRNSCLIQSVVESGSVSLLAASSCWNQKKFRQLVMTRNMSSYDSQCPPPPQSRESLYCK